MNKRVLADSAQRRAIIENLEQNYFVEAGAGSGKTHSLVGRIIALVESGTATMEEVTAITFTRKAAGELKERLQIELEKAVGEATDEAGKNRLKTALEQLDRCFIGTIHSFCSSILRERPVEAGLDPNFTTIEGLEERLLERQAWDSFILDQYLHNRTFLDELSEIDIDPRQLFEAYRTMNLYPEVEKVLAAVPRPVVGQQRRELLDFARQAKQNMPDYEPKPEWDRLQKKVRKILSWNRIFDLKNDVIFFRLLAELETPKADVTQKRWFNGPLAKDLHQQYEQLWENSLKPLLVSWREYRYPILIRFLEAAERYYRELRLAENKLNYQDLLMHCAELLRDNAEVRAYFQRRYPRLLVDEFQDTDPIQAQIMMYLSGEDCKEKDWTRLKPRPGSLFVVGDPKQSIYRFRRADIDTFQRVREQIVAAGGEVLTLSTNFRSHVELVEWVNEAFESIFQESEPPYQAGYQPMQAVVQTIPADGALQVLPVVEKDSGIKPSAKEDARRVAAWIKNMLEQGVTLSAADGSTAVKALQPQDILLLMQYKKDMLLYAQALQALGIPYNISGGSDLSSSLLVEELHYLLQAVADPGNQLFLVNALRGCLFGFSDQELYDFKQAKGRFCFLSALPDPKLLSNHERWQAAWDIFRKCWRLSRSLNPSMVVQNTIQELGLIPLALTLDLGQSEVAALLQLVELIRQMEEQGITRFAEVVDAVEMLRDEPPEDAVDIEGGRQPGVRIMNLHKAKGLEAEVVILANPMGYRVHEPSYHVSRSGRNPQGYFVISRKKGEYYAQVLAQPPGWQDYCEEEFRYQMAEDMRLLYMAATRAKCLLLVGINPKKPDKSPWHPLEKFLPDKTASVAGTGFLGDLSGPQEVCPESLEELRQMIARPLEDLLKPSCHRQTVTEQVKAGKDGPQRQFTGKGVSWGTAVHRALERLAFQPAVIEDDEWLQALLEEEGRSPGELAELKSQLERVMAMPFWQRMQKAEVVLTEVPFGISQGDTYISGTIDLLFREAGGWVIVDYKSDTIIDQDHRQELLEYYQPQLEAYQQYWQEITGQPVTETIIIFTQ